MKYLFVPLYFYIKNTIRSGSPQVPTLLLPSLFLSNSLIRCFKLILIKLSYIHLYCNNIILVDYVLRIALMFIISIPLFIKYSDSYFENYTYLKVNKYKAIIYWLFAILLFLSFQYSFGVIRCHN